MAGSSPASAELLLPQHPTSLNRVQLRQSYPGCYFLRCHFVGATDTFAYKGQDAKQRLVLLFKLSEHTRSLTTRPPLADSPSPSVVESIGCLSLGPETWRTLQACLSFPGLLSDPLLPVRTPPPQPATDPQPE